MTHQDQKPGNAAMRLTRLYHYLLLTGGWALLGSGLVILPVPVPMPIPVAGLLMLIGAGILTHRSRRFRHMLRHVRHRHGWLSRAVDRCASYAPGGVQRTVRRTRPDLIERHARLRASREPV